MALIDAEVSRRQTASDKEPLHLARLILRRYDGLVRWQGCFWRWLEGSYSAMTDDAIRADLYSAIDAIGQTPTRTKVSDTLDALRAVAFQSDDVCPPCWLGSGEKLAPGQIATRNGVLNLLTSYIDPPSPGLFTLSALPVAYDSEAECPQWEKFLLDIWPEDPESVAALQELFGLLVSGDTSFQKVFLLVGPKRAGKGTVLRILTSLLGRANVAAPTLGSLASPFGLQSLIGKTAALISDARLSGRADQEAIAERLLSVSGEDHVSVPRKFMSDYTAQLRARFVLATNELPRLHDSSGALASRFIPLVLTRSWFGKEDRHLSDRLLSELPGILNWSVNGYQRLSERGRLVIPETAADAMRELQDLGSPIGAFLRNECVVEAGAEITCNLLYSQWRDWCEQHGRDHPGTEQSFGRDLRAAVPGLAVSQPRRDGGRVRIYKGVRLATNDDWHAMEREPNHCRSGEKDTNSHNALDRVPMRSACSSCSGEGCKWCS